MEEHEYSSVAQLKGSMSQKNCSEPSAFERAQYMRGHFLTSRFSPSIARSVTYRTRPSREGRSSGPTTSNIQN